MRWETEADLGAYEARVMPFLLRDPVRNNVHYTLLRYRVDGLVPVESGALWLRCVDDDGETVGFALRTPPHPVLLTELTDEQADALAVHLAATEGPQPGVNGPVAASRRFADRYAGDGAHQIGESRIFRLDEVVAPEFPPDGRLREAVPQDRDLLVNWTAAFHTEAAPHEPLDDPAGPVDMRLGQPHQLWVWDVDGEVVSMAYLGAAAAGVVRVSGVYTPPDLRGNGYASACVAGLSQAALDAGAEACMLFTDLANPTSNKIYQAIGYQPVGDFASWRFA